MWLVTIEGDMAAIWTVTQEWLPNMGINHIIGDKLLCPVDIYDASKALRYTSYIILGWLEFGTGWGQIA